MRRPQVAPPGGDTAGAEAPVRENRGAQQKDAKPTPSRASTTVTPAPLHASLPCVVVLLVFTYFNVQNPPDTQPREKGFSVPVLREASEGGPIVPGLARERALVVATVVWCNVGWWWGAVGGSG